MGETVSSDTGREAGESTRLAWIDRSPLTLCLGSLAIAVVAGLVQVSFGSYSMSVAGAWRAVVDTTVLLDPRWLLNFLLGEQLMRSVLGFQGDLPDLPTTTLIVWNIRLPRVFVVMIVGMNLAVLVGGSGQLPVGIVTGLVGGPYFLYLMRKQDQLGEI